jgi:hypothetical protein
MYHTPKLYGPYVQVKLYFYLYLLRCKIKEGSYNAMKQGLQWAIFLLQLR